MRLVAKVIGVAACGLAALVAAASGWIGEEADGQLAADIGRQTGYARAIYASLEARRTSAAATSPTLDEISELLKHTPATDGPLSMAGFLALNAGAFDEAGHRFAEAVRRNPRNEAARIWLADRAIAAGDANAAIAHLESLIRLDSQRSDIWLNALVVTARLPGGLEAVEARLKASDTPPGWASQLVMRLNKSSLPIDLLRPLNSLVPQAQGGFLQRVEAEMGTEAAFNVWRSYLPTPASGPFTWPYDPLFQSKPGPAPFNWNIRNNLAEFAEAGGLEVTYLGRGTAPFADQSMLLKPGRYRFDVRLSGESSVNGGGLAWQIMCKTSSTQLGKVDIHGLGPAANAYGFEFSVPEAACDAQVLTLRGSPGEFPVRARARITSVEVRRLGDVEPR